MPGDLAEVFRGIQLHSDFAEAAVELGIRGSVADGVVIPQVVSDVLHEIFDFVEVLGKERLSAGDLREFLEIFLRLL